MALWICKRCTAQYSVGAEKCPQCGENDYVEEHEMAKITVAGGTSNADVEGEYDPDNVVDPEDGGDPYTPGPDGARFYAPATIHGDNGEQTDISVKVLPDGDLADARELYKSETAEALKADLKDRGLSTSGNRKALVERLVESDAERAAKAAEGSDDAS